MKPDSQQANAHAAEDEAKAASEQISLEHPEVALSLLEADQLVITKEKTRFGRRKLSLSARILMWGLRIYVVIMLVIVLVSVLQVLHTGH